MTFRIAIAAVLLSTACGPTIDLTSGLVVESVSTGWADAGRIDGHHRIVPSLSFKLKNVAGRKLRTLQVNAIFRRVSEEAEWGTSFLTASGTDGLDPGAETPRMTVKSSLGYTGTDGSTELLQNSQFVDARVELFAKYGSANWTRIGEYQVQRQLLNP
jgi:hypothetical protein